MTPLRAFKARGRSIARSLRRSVARPLSGPVVGSVGRSVSLVRSVGRSVARSHGRSIARSVGRSKEREGRAKMMYILGGALVLSSALCGFPGARWKTSRAPRRTIAKNLWESTVGENQEAGFFNFIIFPEWSMVSPGEILVNRTWQRYRVGLGSQFCNRIVRGAMTLRVVVVEKTRLLLVRLYDHVPVRSSIFDFYWACFWWLLILLSCILGFISAQ